MSKIFAILSFGIFFTLSANAQQDSTEHVLVQAAVYEYIEGRNNGDVKRLEKAFLPNAVLKGVARTQEQSVMSLADYMAKQNARTQTQLYNGSSIHRLCERCSRGTSSAHLYYAYLLRLPNPDESKWPLGDCR